MFDSQRVLFEIPVYRLSFDQWMVDEQRRAAPYVAAQSRLRSATEAAILAEQLTNRQTWAYNETVAWIEVDGFHDVIKAYLWQRKGQRQHRHPSQPFEWIGRLGEMWIDPSDSNEGIASALRQLLGEWTRSTPGLSTRSVGFNAFDNIAPYFDWHSALIACEYR